MNLVNKEEILEFIREEAYSPMLDEELVDVFKIEKEEIGDFLKVLDAMEERGEIIKTKKNRYASLERMNLIAGKLQKHAKGFGFILSEVPEQSDVFISPTDMNGSMHNDRVIARIIKNGGTNKRSEGEIIRIVERANTEIVGMFESSKDFGFVIPDDRKIKMDVYIPRNKCKGAKDGDKVVVEVTKWPKAQRNPEGKVIEILGHKDDIGTDIISIIRKYKLPESFPDKVEEEAQRISEIILPEEIKGRKDLRDKTIITIDGADAKDLDDAVSVEILSNGNYLLGVHIADVTHYVGEHTQLNKEALKRATSVYLVDRVIPMLPRKLSNGICSLNPKVDRLTLSVNMEITKEGKVVNQEMYESVIKTAERMTYTDVSDILEKEEPQVMEKYEYLIDNFKTMEELAKILRKKRANRGSIDFDFEESKIILDEAGVPIEIRKAERRVANKIIEEFMLVCNETVAEHFFWAELPFVYRVHEEPNLEKIESFNKFIHNFGYHLKGVTNEIHPRTLQDLLKKVVGTKEERIINTLMLRSLKKARYSAENSGHFGLAAQNYCHFTSPIRRYPDLMIHRIIKEFLHGDITASRIKKLKPIVEEVAKQSSERERIAVEAERETDDLKMTEYMSHHIGDIFEGIISSVVSFGMFIELDNTIEGLVRMSSLIDDYYIYDEENYLLIGERTKKTYRIGDDVKIKVIKADIDQREIDFMIVE
ncbi:ribonuclease R [Lutibacter sp. B2]|nr:ribonuclease R [Lutibacter sp. B2]